MILDSWTECPTWENCLWYAGKTPAMDRIFLTVSPICKARPWWPLITELRKDWMGNSGMWDRPSCVLTGPCGCSPGSNQNYQSGQRRGVLSCREFSRQQTLKTSKAIRSPVPRIGIYRRDCCSPAIYLTRRLARKWLEKYSCTLLLGDGSYFATTEDRQGI